MFLLLLLTSCRTHTIFNPIVLLDIFKSHSRNARVILPLLKTLDVLVSHRCLDDLILDSSNPFLGTLLELLTKEGKNCGDVHRLFACIDVALGLVSAASSAASSSEGDYVSKRGCQFSLSSNEENTMSQHYSAFHHLHGMCICLPVESRFGVCLFQTSAPLSSCSKICGGTSLCVSFGTSRFTGKQRWNHHQQ